MPAVRIRPMKNGNGGGLGRLASYTSAGGGPRMTAL